MVEKIKVNKRVVLKEEDKFDDVGELSSHGQIWLYSCQ